MLRSFDPKEVHNFDRCILMLTDLAMVLSVVWAYWFDCWVIVASLFFPYIHSFMQPT